MEQREREAAWRVAVGEVGRAAAAMAGVWAAAVRVRAAVRAPMAADTAVAAKDRAVREAVAMAAGGVEE